MKLEIEREKKEMALWVMTGVGPLPKLTLLEAESGSLVQLLFFSFCSFCNKI